jgi:hypothetical protein
MPTSVFAAPLPARRASGQQRRNHAASFDDLVMWIFSIRGTSPADPI